MLLHFTNQNQDLGWVPTLRHPRSHHPACGGTAACAICKPSLPGRSQTPGTQQWLARKTILITWMMMPSSTSWNLFEEELWNAFPAYTCSRGGRNSRLDTAGNHPVWSNSHLPQRTAGEWPTINGNITCPRLACHRFPLVLRSFPFSEPQPCRSNKSKGTSLAWEWHAALRGW